ncbi:MAG: hypothetical protein NZR01_11840 [Bryobacteraceae bacterium]|nr:hypothetical protein [Bryobacteraceae bacterium]
MNPQDLPASAAALRELAGQLWQKQAWAEALPLHEALCRLPEATGWDFYRLARILSKLEQHEAALEACRAAWQRFPGERPEGLRNLYGWSIYRTELRPLASGRPEDGEEAESAAAGPGADGRLVRAIRAAEAVCQLTRQEPYSPYTRTVLALAKMLRRQARWQELEQWTARLDPARLSPQPWRSGGEREMASELETWYGYRTRALLGMERWEECAGLCLRYEQQGLKPHYDWDVWIPFYRAQALHALGRLEEAAELTGRLLAKKRAACLLRFRARLYRECGQPERAWQTALDGALELQEPKNDPQLLVLLAELAAGRGDLEAARRHVELAAVARLAEDWKIPEALRQQAAALGATFPERASEADSSRLFRELRSWWWAALEAAEPRDSGTVERVLAGGSGFLRSDGGQTLYFRDGRLRDLAPGLRVSFWVRPSWDAKKQRVSSCAIRLRSGAGGRAQR